MSRGILTGDMSRQLGDRTHAGGYSPAVEVPAPQDTLKLEYPALAEDIDKALAEGWGRDDLRRFLAEREVLALSQYSPKEVDEFLGRTDKTQAAFWDAMRDQNDDSYVRIMKDSMSEAKVRDILNTARFANLPPGLLLTMPELIPEAEKAAGERLSVLGQIMGAAKNAVAGYKTSSAGALRLEAESLRQDAATGGAAAEMEAYGLRGMPAGEYARQVRADLAEAEGKPVEGETPNQKMKKALDLKIADVTKSAEEKERGAAEWRARYRPPDSEVGAFLLSAIENSGMTVTSALRSGAAWTLGGPMGGLLASTYNTWDESHREAGEVFVEALRRKQDPEAAFRAAMETRNKNLALLGVTNYAVDVLTLGLGGAGRMLKGSGGAARSVAGTALGRGATFLEGGLDTVLSRAAGKITGSGLADRLARVGLTKGVPLVAGAIPEGLEEYGQEWIKMSALGDDMDPDALAEAFKMGMGQAVIHSLFGLGASAALRGGVNAFARHGVGDARARLAMDAEVKQAAELGAALARGDVKPEDVVGEDPVVFLPRASLSEEMATSLGVEPQENAAPTAETSEGEGSGEVAVRQSDWDRFAKENPEEAEGLKNDLRSGTRGVTAREKMERLTQSVARRAADKLGADTPEADAARRLSADTLGRLREVNEHLDVPLSEEAMVAQCRIYGHYLLANAKRYGVSVEELHRVNVERGTTPADFVMNQPVNPGVDLEQKVPVLDLTNQGLETVTPKELLAHLRELLKKNDTWISRDAEIFARLPKGKKLKHVAYSSRTTESSIKQVRNKIAGSLEELTQEAVLIESSPNKDPSKQDVENYHRLYVPVRTAQGVQIIRIVAEELKSSDGIKPTDVEIYDVILEGQEESPAVSHGPLAEEVVPSPGAPLEITIADMLRGVKGENKKPYIQDGRWYEQSAYHGSPHRNISAFDTNRVGSGIGTQWQGWGLYFATRRDIAEWYRVNHISRLAGRIDLKKQPTFAGKALKDVDWGTVFPELSPETAQEAAENVLLYFRAELEEYRKAIRQGKLSWIDTMREIHGFITSAIRIGLHGFEFDDALVKKFESFFLENLEVPMHKATSKEGQLYKVEIPDNDVLLNIEERLSEQPVKVREALEKVAVEGGWKFNPAWTGRELLYRLAEEHGNSKDSFFGRGNENDRNKETSLLLRKHGIPGLRYFDERNQGVNKTNSYNYVIFDDSAIDVQETYYQSAYHGTPHRGIERMSTQHIGTGEGNQAFGWGIYSASKRGIAENYRKVLSTREIQREDITFIGGGGERFSFQDGAWRDGGGVALPDHIEMMLTDLVETVPTATNTLTEVINDLKEDLQFLIENEKDSDERAQYEDALNWLEETQLATMELSPDLKGQLYRLEVSENDVLLDWDTTLSEQPEAVRRAVEEIAAGLSPEALADLGGNANILTDPKKTGAEFYGTLSSLTGIGGDKGASLLLKEHGVPGLRYLDGTSRNKGEGSHNFVIWDEDAMCVEETYYQSIGEAGARAMDAAEELELPDPVASKYVEVTERSRNIPIDSLHKTEPMDSEAVERAKKNMQEAERGERGKRTPLIVTDRGDGTYFIIDGNNTFENLKTLGAKSVPVEIKTPYQKQVKDLESLYARNAAVQMEFNELLKTWQAELGGTILVRPGLKGEARVREKVEKGYGGDYSRVLDILAGSLVFDSAEQMTEAFQGLMGKTAVVRIKDKWTKPDDTGYRDVNLTVRLSNGILAELQLHHKGIIEAKDGLGHLLYEFIRSNEQNDEMIPFIEQAKEISRVVYEAGLNGQLNLMANSMAQALEIARRLSSQDSTTGPIETLLSELSALTLNTLAPSSSESIAPESRNSIANGTSSPFSKYRSTLNTSFGDETNGRYTTDISRGKQKSNGRNAPNDGTRGYVELSRKRALIGLNKSANESTFLHELWHVGLDDLLNFGRREDAPEQIREDLKTAMEWLGITEADLTNRDRMKEAHEKWADAGEAYFQTGQAPTKALQGAFERIRAWLMRIYNGIKNDIELTDEMRGVFDRLLATREEITEAYEARASVGELALENTLLRERIAELERQETELDAQIERLKGKTTDLEIRRRLELRSQKAKMQMAAKALRDKRAEKRALRKDVRRMAQQIEAAAEDTRVIWHRQVEIREKLKGLDLKNRAKKTLELRQDLAEYVAQNPEAAETLNPKDLKYLGATSLGEMTVEELRELHGTVMELREMGRRELEFKNLVTAERIDKARGELMGTMLKNQKKKKNKKDEDKEEEVKKPPTGAVAGREDMGKIYKGVRGKFTKLMDWTYANTLGAMRFMDHLDGHKGTYEGPWVRTFVDQANAARDAELRHIFRRREALEAAMIDQGLTPKDLAKTRDVPGVPKRSGEPWTVDELLSIYAGMKNERSQEAILYGNFKGRENPEADAAACVSVLTEPEMALADAVMRDYEINFDRVNNALIEVYNKGMDQEENYTPMKRLEYTTAEGLMDPDSSEALMDAHMEAGGIGKLERGFQTKRLLISEKNQRGIDLGLLSIWNSQMEVQEHAAAFAPLLRDLRRILMGNNAADPDMTPAKLVKEVYGEAAWKNIINYYNILTKNDAKIAHDVLESASKWFAKNMSVAYLCGNLGTILKQTTSYPRFLPYCGPTQWLVATGEFAANPKAFLEWCYEQDPQLKARQGNVMLSALKTGTEGGVYGELLQLGLEPIALMDRMTAAIGWKAVYNANVKAGLSHEAAVREAQRAVLLTQQSTHAKDMPRIWQQRGYVKLAMIFTSEAAQTFGITLYDLNAAIRRGDIPQFLWTLTALTLTAGMMTLVTEGPPDENEPEEWLKWWATALARQSIESLPLVGKEALTVWDGRSGFFGGTQSAFIAPFAKLAMGLRALADGKDDNDERALFSLLEGSALLAPFPATAVRRTVRAIQDTGEGETKRALKRMVGMRVQDKRLKRRAAM